MQIIFDHQLQINANLDKVWEVLCSTDQRKLWQSGIVNAKLLYGTEGYRGAKVELTLEPSGKKVIEAVHRSRPLERLHTQFQLGDCGYQQIFYLSRIDEDTTQLTYHCKQDAASGWRRILSMQPAIPNCVKPEIFLSLAKHLEDTTTSAV